MIPAATPDDLPPIIVDSGPAPRPVPRWRWWIHLLLIGSYPLLIAAVSWTRTTPRGPALSESVSGLLLTCGLELLQFSVIFGLGWIASRATRDELLLHWRPGWWAAPLGLGYSVAIRLALGIILVAVSGTLVMTNVVTQESLQEFAIENRPEVENVVDVKQMRDDPVYLWLSMTLVSFVVAGLREELWRTGVLAGLRALFPRTFGSRRGELLAIIAIAIVFGAGHVGMGMLAATMAGILGVFLGAIMVFHRSIWPAVLAHGFFDATTMALLPWLMERMPHWQ